MGWVCNVTENPWPTRSRSWSRSATMKQRNVVVDGIVQTTTSDKTVPRTRHRRHRKCQRLRSRQTHPKDAFRVKRPDEKYDVRSLTISSGENKRANEAESTFVSTLACTVRDAISCCSTMCGKRGSRWRMAMGKGNTFTLSDDVYCFFGKNNTSKKPVINAYFFPAGIRVFLTWKTAE